MNSHWHTAAQLAAMKLPGLPISEPGVHIRAAKEGWKARQVKCKGGKGGMRTEYDVNFFTKEIRDAILHFKAAGLQESILVVAKAEKTPCLIFPLPLAQDFPRPVASLCVLPPLPHRRHLSLPILVDQQSGKR